MSAMQSKPWSIGFCQSCNCLCWAYNNGIESYIIQAFVGTNWIKCWEIGKTLIFSSLQSNLFHNGAVMVGQGSIWANSYLKSVKCGFNLAWRFLSHAVWWYWAKIVLHTTWQATSYHNNKHCTKVQGYKFNFFISHYTCICVVLTELGTCNNFATIL